MKTLQITTDINELEEKMSDTLVYQWFKQELIFEFGRRINHHEIKWEKLNKWMRLQRNTFDWLIKEMYNHSTTNYEDNVEYEGLQRAWEGMWRDKPRYSLMEVLVYMMTEIEEMKIIAKRKALN